MTVVIDVGAARYGGDYSIERLIEQFEPTHLYAIDPSAELQAPEVEGVVIELIQAAAWTEDGMIGYRADGLNSWVTRDPRAPQVRCLDLGRFIIELEEKHAGEKIVLKLDCEGSEWNILPNLHARGIDELLDVAIVEWHGDQETREQIEQGFFCEVREWPY